MYKNGKNIAFTDRSINSVNSFLRDISKSKPLTKAEEYALWHRMQQGSLQARNQLICANLRYVVTVAKKYFPAKAVFDDLIMAGCEGIIKAADKFNATFGFRFISFATWFVESEICKAAHDYTRHNVISLDKHMDMNDEESSTFGDTLSDSAQEAPDWDLRTKDALYCLKARADKCMYGAGELAGDLYKMLQNGYTTSDFARKHHLSKKEMSRLFDILQKEAEYIARQSA